MARREIKKQQEKAEELKVIEYMKQKAVSVLVEVVTYNVYLNTDSPKKHGEMATLY